MTEVDNSRRTPGGRQLASNLRELLNKVDIKSGAERSDRFEVEEAEVSTMIESEAERSQSPQASLREAFAKARTGLPRASISSRAGTSASSSRLPRPRRSSVDSDISSAPTTIFTPARHREGDKLPHLNVDQLSVGDGDLTQERTPVARAPPHALVQTPSAAASFHALRARLENASDTHTDASTDLTGWDRSARSLMTTRGQASSSKLNMYLDDDEETNLLDEDLGGVPALTVSHIDDSNMRFTPSVGNTTRTPIVSRNRPGPIPKGPSLQSASLAERLAEIPDDGLDFDDTDREDFDRNRMDDDSDDLLNHGNDLLRSSSPGPDQNDSPMRPTHRSPRKSRTAAARPISGSWENVMNESLLSLPVPPEEPEERLVPARTPKPTSSAVASASSSSSGSGAASRLMQTIQSEEDSFQKSQQENSHQTATDIRHDTANKSEEQDISNASKSDNNASVRTSRLSTFGRSRLPLAKPSLIPPNDHDIQASVNPRSSEISFPRASMPTSPTKQQSAPERAAQSPGANAHVSPTHIHSPPNSSHFNTPNSPARPVSRAGAPVTPSRIPRVSLHRSQPSLNHMEDVTGNSPSRHTPQTPARSQSSLGHNPRLTPARSTSSLGHRATPPETDVDRERAWGKPLPKLTHANLRMRHESMESSLGSSVYGGLSPGRPGSVMGMSATGRPTTPSNRSFVGYSVRHGSEVSSSQGSAGSDEDAQLRRSRKMSLPSSVGMKSGAELRGPHSRHSLTSPTAASLARSAGITRHSSLKATPNKPARAPIMRHSASFAGSSVSGVSDRASPANSPGPRKITGLHGGDNEKDVEHIRERDWGRPSHSKAPGISSISPRGPSRSGGTRARVVSGGSVGGSREQSESPIPRAGTSGVGLKPRPHTIHFGSMTERAHERGQERRGPLEGGEELLEGGREWLDSEMHENEEVMENRVFERIQEESGSAPNSPPSPSRSIPLPPSPLQPRMAPAESSVSLFKLPPGEIDSGSVAKPTPHADAPTPESPTERVIPAQPESPTISFMDTLPALPEPPSDDEIDSSPMVAPVPAQRPSVNTRLNAHHRIVREASPASASGSGSEKTPRVSTIMLQAPSPNESHTPTPPINTDIRGGGLGLVGVESNDNKTGITRTRSRSNTLGTVPRININLDTPREEIDSAATPVATRWMEKNRSFDRAEGSSSREDRVTPQTEASLVVPIQRSHSEIPLPMVSQRGKEIIQRMQHSTTALARDLEVESSRSLPPLNVVRTETEQIVKLSSAARAERERLERLRLVRQGENEKAMTKVPTKRWSIPWILVTMFLTALCAWLALYALSQHATNVYLDPLYPILYGGDVEPLRHARTVDSFPSSWHAHMVPKGGAQRYFPISSLSYNWGRVWGFPNWTMQQLLLGWPPS